MLDCDQRFGYSRIDEVRDFELGRLAAQLVRHDHGEVVIGTHERGGHLIEKPDTEFRRHLFAQGQGVGKSLHGGLQLRVHGVDRRIEQCRGLRIQLEAVEPL